MTPDEIASVESLLDALIENRPIELSEDPGALDGIQQRILKLSDMLLEAQVFSVKLSEGDMEYPAPPRANYLAAGLKQLQAQMLHLTWQTQRVAAGDYGQRIDFMGDFSDAFNEMVRQLCSREATLRDQQKVMETIFNLIEPILVISDTDSTNVLYANEQAIHRFQVRHGINIAFNDTVTEIISGFADGIKEHQFFDPTDDRWYSVSHHVLSWHEHENAHLYYCRDITAHKTREKRLGIVANTDELTGISNRRAFDHAYAQQWSTCLSAQKPISLIVFDLDFFKNYNDSYGHLAGDKMLAEFAHILNRVIGRGDDIVARYGGEEFVAALPFTGPENAMQLARSVCEITANRTLRITNARGVEVDTSITVSAGVTSAVPTDEIHPQQVLRAADRSLYEAKQLGRNRAHYLPFGEE